MMQKPPTTESRLPATVTIACRECGAPIGSRDELAVAGHGLRPFHERCYTHHAARQPWYRKPSWPLNRWGSLLRFNGLLVTLVLGLHLTIAPLPEDGWVGLGSILLIANAWLLLARLVSYVRMERHLPTDRDGAR